VTKYSIEVYSDWAPGHEIGEVSVMVPDEASSAVSHVGTPAAIADHVRSELGMESLARSISRLSGPVAFVDGVEVEEGRRGTGLGPRLVQTLLDELRHAGVRWVVLMAEALGEREIAREDLYEFYRFYGFERWAPGGDVEMDHRGAMRLRLKRSNPTRPRAVALYELHDRTTRLPAPGETMRLVHTSSPTGLPAAERRLLAIAHAEGTAWPVDPQHALLVVRHASADHSGQKVPLILVERSGHAQNPDKGWWATLLLIATLLPIVPPL